MVMAEVFDITKKTKREKICIFFNIGSFKLHTLFAAVASIPLFIETTVKFIKIANT